MYLYFSLITNLEKLGPVFSKFQVPLLLTHPELVASTPLLVPNWIPGNQHFWTLVYPNRSPTTLL